jgi:ATP-dependent Clp protease ATP-binding subunit ClpC
MLRKLFGGGDKKHPLEERNASASLPSKKVERFTQRARKVLSLAQEEAKQRHDHFIRTEHLLLGLLREDGGIAAMVLRQLGLTLEAVEAAMPQPAASPDLPTQSAAGPETVMSILEEMASQPAGESIQLTPEIKRTLELAVDEARRLGLRFVGTEHLLLALTRQETTIAFHILSQAGITGQKVRAQVSKVIKDFNQNPPSHEEQQSTP